MAAVNTMNPVIRDGFSDEIFNLLRAIYWQGLDREICQLVLAYQEMEKHPRGSDFERDDHAPVDLDACNFKRFCTLLSKYTFHVIPQ